MTTIIIALIALVVVGVLLELVRIVLASPQRLTWFEHHDAWCWTDRSGPTSVDGHVWYDSREDALLARERQARGR